MEKVSEIGMGEEEEVKYFDLVYYRDVVIAEVEKLEKLKTQHRNGRFETMSCLKAAEYLLTILLQIFPTKERRRLLMDLEREWEMPLGVQEQTIVKNNMALGSFRVQSQPLQTQQFHSKLPPDEHSTMSNLNFYNQGLGEIRGGEMKGSRQMNMREGKSLLDDGSQARRKGSVEEEEEEWGRGAMGRQELGRKKKADAMIQDDDFEEALWSTPKTKKLQSVKMIEQLSRNNEEKGKNFTYWEIEKQASKGVQKEPLKEKEPLKGKGKELAQLIMDDRFASEVKIENARQLPVPGETILNFSKLGENLLAVEAGKKRAKLLDLRTMKEVRDVKAMDAVNDRLFKAYEFDGVAYLTYYDVEKIATFDISNYQKLGKVMTTKEGFQSMTQLRESWLVVGENLGFIQVVNSKKREVTQTFQCKEQKDILEIFATSRGNEVCMSTLGGIKFANLTEKGASSFIFKENEEEVYFPNKITRSVLEHQKEMLLVCIKAQPFVFCVDRLKKVISRKIENPSSDNNIFSLVLFPDFSMDSLPFVFLRDRKGVSIVNLKTESGWPIVNSPFNYEAGNTQRLEVYVDQEWNQVDIIVSEFESKDSVIKKVAMPADFRKALTVLASQ